MEEQLRPKVGLGVMVMKDNKVLLGLRKGTSHADGVWCFPGGHLEHGESFTAGAQRETMEEAGIEIENIRFIAVLNGLDFLPKHFVCIGLAADWKSGEPRPEDNGKMTDWTWYDLDKLPEPIYPPNKKFIDAYKNGVNFIDT